jgi:alkylhydroperoxidase/carboxymuconolactone decarboxylase family protein YurZ
VEKMDQTQTSWFILHSPELGNAFEDFYQLCNENGVLDRKTRGLLMVALASVFRLPNRTGEQIRNALDAGATKEEVTEVLLIAAAEGAWAQLASVDRSYLEHTGPSNE